MKTKPMMNRILIDQVAQIIYHNEGGMDDSEWHEATGKYRKIWKTQEPWDTNPNELCEHERDEYRMQALEVLRFLMEQNMLV